MNRVHRSLVRDPFFRLQETLDEIRDDYFDGRLTADQRQRYEFEAFHDLSKAQEARDRVVSN